MLTAGSSVVLSRTAAGPATAVPLSHVSFSSAVGPEPQEEHGLHGPESYIIRALFTAEDP